MEQKVNKELEKWQNKPCDEKLKVLLNWCQYEEYSYVAECRSISDLEHLFIFLQFELGVEFVASAYEMVCEEEQCDECPSPTQIAIDRFNEKIGYYLI